MSKFKALLIAAITTGAFSANAYVVDTAALTSEMTDVATNVGAIFGVVVVAVLAVTGAKIGLSLLKSMASKAR